jgi:hypothetical protein
VPVDARLGGGLERRLREFLEGRAHGQTPARHPGLPDVQG